MAQPVGGFFVEKSRLSKGMGGLSEPAGRPAY